MKGEFKKKNARIFENNTDIVNYFHDFSFHKTEKTMDDRASAKPLDLLFLFVS